MRSLRRGVAGAVLLGLAVTGCGAGSGTSSTTRNVLSGLSARDATLLATTRAATTSLRYDIDAKIGIDTSRLSGLSADEQRSLATTLGGAGTISFSGRVEQESPARMRLDLSVAPLFKQRLDAVLYDGSTYYSTDGGASYHAGGSLRSLGGGMGISPSDTGKLFDGLPAGSFVDLGPATMDGTTVEHYRATLTKDALLHGLSSAMQNGSASGGQAQQLVQGFAQMLTINAAVVDAYVRPDDGRLDRYTVDLDLGFDIGKLAAAFGALAPASSQNALPSGALRMTMTMNAHLYDYGAAIHVARPANVTPASPGDAAGLFGG